MEQKSTEQQQAQNLYFQTELTQQQIADLLNINRKTLYTWIKDGDWRRAKYAAKHVPCILAEQYMSQLGAMNGMIAQREERPWPTKEEADIMRKVTMTYKNITGNKKPISENIELFADFAMELRNENYQVAKDFIPHMDKYIQTIIKKENGLDNAWKSYMKDKHEDQEYLEWLSRQPKPQPIAAYFPPGYFTMDYDPEKAAAGAPPFSRDDSDGTNITNLQDDAVDTLNDPNSQSQIPNSIQINTPNSESQIPNSIQISAPNSQTPIPNSNTQNGVSNGVTATPENTLNPLPVNTSAENDNTDLSTINFEKQGEVNSKTVIVSSVELPPELPAKADRWAKFLEEKFKISEDPYVTRKNGITIIRRGSPLWGGNSSIFF